MPFNDSRPRRRDVRVSPIGRIVFFGGSSTSLAALMTRCSFCLNLRIYQTYHSTDLLSLLLSPYLARASLSLSLSLFLSG